jgi:hypothetical protein
MRTQCFGSMLKVRENAERLERWDRLDWTDRATDELAEECIEFLLLALAADAIERRDWTELLDSYANSTFRKGLAPVWSERGLRRGLDRLESSCDFIISWRRSMRLELSKTMVEASGGNRDRRSGRQGRKNEDLHGCESQGVFVRWCCFRVACKFRLFLGRCWKVGVHKIDITTQD